MIDVLLSNNRNHWIRELFIPLLSHLSVKTPCETEACHDPMIPLLRGRVRVREPAAAGQRLSLEAPSHTSCPRDCLNQFIWDWGGSQLTYQWQSPLITWVLTLPCNPEDAESHEKPWGDYSGNHIWICPRKREIKAKWLTSLCGMFFLSTSWWRPFEFCLCHLLFNRAEFSSPPCRSSGKLRQSLLIHFLLFGIPFELPKTCCHSSSSLQSWQYHEFRTCMTLAELKLMCSFVYVCMYLF